MKTLIVSAIVPIPLNKHNNPVKDTVTVVHQPEKEVMTNDTERNVLIAMFIIAFLILLWLGSMLAVVMREAQIKDEDHGT